MRLPSVANTTDVNDLASVISPGAPPGRPGWTGSARATPIPLPTLMENIKKILTLIKEEVHEADRKAEHACIQSKYSIQDYWMCVEFKFQRLHDRIAKEHGLPRLEEMSYRRKLNEFRKSLKE